MDGKWSMSEAHLSRYVIAMVKFERLHYAWLRLRLRGYSYAARHIGNATASLKSAYVYYVYDHQRHLLTTTSLQIGIVPQLLCQRRSIALSMLGLVIFVAVERTFVCFTKGHDHLFQILFVAAAYEQTNAISRAPKLQ